MPLFKVTGIGIETGRKRTRTYTAYNEDRARQMALADGTETKEIELVPSQPPTERQLEFARDVGINVPAEATIDEVSDLLSRYQDRDKPATERHRSFADYYEVEVTKYIGKKKLFCHIFNKLTQPGNEEDLAVWFAFRVYREITNASDTAAVQHPNDPRIAAIGRNLAKDEKALMSIRRYDGDDLIWFGEWTASNGDMYSGGSNRTAAYKAAASAIRAEFELPQQGRKQSKKSAGKSESAGCFSVIILGAIMPICLYYSWQQLWTFFA